MKNQKLIAKMLVLLLVMCLSVPASATLVANYTMEGNANDVSGSAVTYNGTAFSSDGVVDWETESADPLLGGSLHMAGGSPADYMNCGDVPISSTATTIAYWLNSDYKANFDLINKTALDDSGVGLRIMYVSNGSVKLWTGSDSAKTYDVTMDDAGTVYDIVSNGNGIWTHQAWVFDNSMIHFYVDGELRTSQAATGEISAPGVDFRLGHLSWTNAYNFRGNIDDVRIYDNALSAGEVAAIVPEPATLMLLGMGAFGLLRRKRN